MSPSHRRPPVEHADDGGGRSKVAADDAPEPLVGGVVDLGVVATEFLALGIDPYPRKSGVEFSRSGRGRRFRRTRLPLWPRSRRSRAVHDRATVLASVGPGRVWSAGVGGCRTTIGPAAADAP